MPRWSASPLLDRINLVPKAMSSKFLDPEHRLERYDPRLRVAGLHDEGLLIGIADCMTMGGSGASWWDFAAEYGLRWTSRSKRRFLG